MRMLATLILKQFLGLCVRACSNMHSSTSDTTLRPQLNNLATMLKSQYGVTLVRDAGKSTDEPSKQNLSKCQQSFKYVPTKLRKH